MKKIIASCIIAVTGIVPAFASQPDILRVQLARDWDCDSVFTIVGAVSSQWWKIFDCPMLDSLISVGQENNYNIASAAKRLEIARSQLRQARGAYSPVIGLSAAYNYGRTAGTMTSFDTEPEKSSYASVAASMSWEIDVFGKIRAQTKHASENVAVTAAEYDGVMLSLQAGIVQTYIDLAVHTRQLEVAREHISRQGRTVEITEDRFKAGLESKLAVAQARTQWLSTQATVPPLEASIESDKNALAVLLGISRAQLPEALSNSIPFPPYNQLPPAGVPADLLRRRPDIVEAERNIHLAAAELGIARSAYLPSLSLTANIGTDAHRPGDLFSSPSFGWSVVPTLSWTVFDGFARRNAAAAARFAMEAAIDNYNNSVLAATEEVRNAMAMYIAAVKTISLEEQAVEASIEQTNLSLDLYKQGLTMFSNVVDAQLTYLTNQNSLITARGNALTALVELNKALGGGWTY